MRQVHACTHACMLTCMQKTCIRIRLMHQHMINTHICVCKECVGSVMSTLLVLAAAGEWECVMVTFSPDGKPTPLPERYVPDEYRNWDIEICDWQSQNR